MHHARPRQNMSPLNHRCCAMPERWITHEGLLATAESREIYLFSSPEFQTSPNRKPDPIAVPAPSAPR